MAGPLRVAVKPELGALHAAPGTGLLHERAGHEGHLIQQDARQGDAMDEGGAAFIPPAEQGEVIGAPECHERIPRIGRKGSGC